MHHLLFISGLLLPVLVVSSQQYPYISKKMSWMEAQKFCREMFSDLATVNTEEDMSGLLRIILAAVTQNVYIGLYRSGVFTWHWTLPGNGYLEFQNWKAGQPKVGSEQDGCAGMDQNGEWFEDSCSTQRTFVCTDVNSGTYILVPISKSWRDAQEHCRGFYTELASAMNSSENQKIKVAAGSQQVWIGLFKDSWVWSDSSGSSFRFWNTNQPSNIKGQDCMVVTTNPTGRWNDVSCANANFFICQGDDLVLVRENSTWSEAVSYCREHHMDLVSVLSKWQQQSVERKASLASSSHVWLGLRYTCTFGFWFWTRDGEAGCYQNWATGQGTVGSKDCSMAGAMESSGEHQWVQRPQSERFNFICFTCVTCKTCAAALP
uniref:C-type lectin domain-containing protein n=1 Tax=Astyanax mexicanus TaxID=7994 RepID=A0A8B9GVT7_ASTMX